MTREEIIYYIGNDDFMFAPEYEIEKEISEYEEEIRADERKKIAEAILVSETLCKEVKDIMLRLFERIVEQMKGETE